MRLGSRWYQFRALSSALGVGATIRYLFHQRLGRRQGAEYWIHPKQVIHPLLCIRRYSSDLAVFNQIFVEREYGCLDDMTNVRLIIDCGAYVGYSSAYFLSHHPNCQLVAVEPDSENFAVLRRNLDAYGNRAKVVNAGVWSHAEALVMSQNWHGDGLEWSRQVRRCGQDEEPDLEGVDIGSLLASTDHDRISLLKVDVEGAEAVIFSVNYQSWLDKVDAIAIELHDDTTFGKGSEVFFEAIRGQGFNVSRSGELTICRRPGV